MEISKEKSNTLDSAIKAAYRMDETLCLEALLPLATLPRSSILRVQDIARDLVLELREKRLKSSGLDAFLHAYDLSSEEGIALMCLAEALQRIPDNATRDRLIKDKITTSDWSQHLGNSHSVFVNAATWGLMLTGKILEPQESTTSRWSAAIKRLLSKGGEPVIRQAVTSAMKILAKQFVMGETIESAIQRARKNEAIGYRYSYDMLGEAAKTALDADHYFAAYQTAIQEIGKSSALRSRGKPERGPILGPGISIKLSALHPRYEWVNRERIFAELYPKLKILLKAAKEVNIGVTIDAEEADRLELSLLLFEQLIQETDLQHWEGLGLAVQAYQKRAAWVMDWVIELAKRERRRIMVRLVKGAYWDSEIKWSQEKGLSGYPVFTRKTSTDVCYLACVKKMLAARDVIYPQFATHNAYTVAAILEMAGEYKDYEFQCLHGMGASLYDNIVDNSLYNIPCRIYAPVGSHEHLLAYLVRRLLENGANSSFVNRILDEATPIEDLIADPVELTKQLADKPHPKIPLPNELYGKARPNSKGIDFTDSLETKPFFESIQSLLSDLLNSLNSLHPLATPGVVEEKIVRAEAIFPLWANQSIESRASCLERMANLLETHKPELIALLVREGGKSVVDALSEVREAIDYCWYYAEFGRKQFRVKHLPGPTGEYNQLELRGRGIMACISPWNFPLAIFLGQVTASLVAGNVVIAKPASQTPLVATKAIALLHEAGVPVDALQLLVGSGSVIGDRLSQDERIAGIMFTGSTATAQHINQKLAARRGAIVPFIAETGGQNVMIVDSSALPEQVVQDAISSAFNSAGQRCSALRVLYLQEDVSEKMLAMLMGAMAELKIGDPLELSTDVGPVIDEVAKTSLLKHVEHMNGLDKKMAKLLYECYLPKSLPVLPRGAFFAPRLYRIADIKILPGEVFGPILHVITYRATDLDKVIADINATGFGLTLGIHSRIQDSVDYIRTRVHVGNIYVNRNIIGAVVGVQPFGGEGLSGTGPKAGGPHILPRLAVERTLSVNVTAAGGNIKLLSLREN